MPRSHRSSPSAPIDTRKLALFILSLALAVAATAGTLWYNLRRAGSQNRTEPLFTSIVNRLQEPVNASEIP